MTKFEKTNIIISILGLIIAGIAVYVAYEAINASENVAQRSGSFDEAKNYLGFSNYDLPDPNLQDTVQFIYGAELDTNAANFSTIPLSINNIGNKDADDISVVIDFPRLSGLAFTDTNIFKNNDIPFVKYKRKVTIQPESNFITYQIDHINPRLSVTLNEPFVFHNTQIIGQVKGKDSKLINFDVDYSIAFNISLLGKNLLSQRQYFNLACFKAKTIDQLCDFYLKGIKRIEGKKEIVYFALPKSVKLSSNPKYPVNMYSVKEEDVYCGIIDNLSPKREVALALYDGSKKLIQLRMYGKSNEFKISVPVK